VKKRGKKSNLSGGQYSGTYLTQLFSIEMLQIQIKIYILFSQV
jgi:hypothetical protein